VVKISCKLIILWVSYERKRRLFNETLCIQSTFITADKLIHKFDAFQNSYVQTDHRWPLPFKRCHATLINCPKLQAIKQSGFTFQPTLHIHIVNKQAKWPEKWRKRHRRQSVTVHHLVLHHMSISQLPLSQLRLQRILSNTVNNTHRWQPKASMICSHPPRYAQTAYLCWISTESPLLCCLAS